MSIVFQDEYVTLLHGDCIDRMRDMADASVDAIVTDPPYGLEFMGKEWDRFSTGKGFRRRENENDVSRADPFGRASARAPEYIAGANYQGWCAEWATEAIRVLKPGGHLLAFGGTRTYHRLACAIEDAGFDIRDCLVWGYASGFPKSLNLDGEWQGWGTALKPAWEPIVMARKPLGSPRGSCRRCGSAIGAHRGEGEFDACGNRHVAPTVAANVLAYGTGALNIDATRIPVAGEKMSFSKAAPFTDAQGGQGRTWNPTSTPGMEREQSEHGRWPANVILTDPIFDGDYPEDVVGGGSSDSGEPHTLRRGETNGQGIGYGSTAEGNEDVVPGGSGGKSRFFLIPKADREERERGLADAPKGQVGGRNRADGRQWDIPGSTLANNKPPPANTHPTVKPIDLMRHLVRLVTPPGGLVLDPFIGSGTTALAASEEGLHCIGIDQSEDYLKIATGRLAATPIGMGL